MFAVCEKEESRVVPGPRSPVPPLGSLQLVPVTRIEKLRNEQGSEEVDLDLQKIYVSGGNNKTV